MLPTGFNYVNKKLPYDNLLIPYVVGKTSPQHHRYLDYSNNFASTESKEFAKGSGAEGAVVRADEFQTCNKPRYRTLLRTFAIPEKEQRGLIKVEILVWICGSDYSIEEYIERRDPDPVIYDVRFDFR